MTTTIKRYEWRGWGEIRRANGWRTVAERDICSRTVTFRRLCDDPGTGWMSRLDEMTLDRMPAHVYADSTQHLAETLRLPEWVAGYLYQDMGTYELTGFTVKLGCDDWNALSPSDQKREWRSIYSHRIEGGNEDGETYTEAPEYVGPETPISNTMAELFKQHALEMAGVDGDTFTERTPEPTPDGSMFGQPYWVSGFDLTKPPIVKPHLIVEHCPECHGKDGTHYGICSKHPESGQESTVAKAEPATPRLQVHMRGDWLDDGENV